MKIKSIISLILALCMMFCVVGCSKGETKEYTSEVWVDGEDTTTVIEGEDGYYVDGNSSGSGTASGNNSGSGSATTKPGDMGGATVTIGRWGTTDDAEVDTTSPSYIAEQKKIKDIEKKYNCKIAYKNIYNAVEYRSAFVSAAMSGIKFADIATLGSGWVYPQHLRAGYLYAIDDYIDLTDVGWDQNMMKQSVVNGKNYLLFQANGYNGVTGIAFNRSVFKKFGQKTPDQYVAENNWTTDTFLSVAKACTGTKDGVSYYGYIMTKAGIDAWGNIFGGENIQVKNGKYIYEPDSKYIAGIQFAYDMLNTWKISPAYGAVSFDSGRVAMSSSVTYSFADLGATMDTDDIGWTYMPKGPGTSDYYCNFSSSACYGIPSAAKNPETLAQIMAAYVYPSKTSNTVEAKLENGFFDATSYNTAVQAIKKAQKSSKLEPTYPYISNGIGWNDFGISEKKSPQQYIASVKAQAQAELDEVWEQ